MDYEAHLSGWGMYEGEHGDTYEEKTEKSNFFSFFFLSVKQICFLAFLSNFWLLWQLVFDSASLDPSVPAHHHTLLL